MPATFSTTRRCPYCGAVVALAECPIVATNFDGVEELGSLLLRDTDPELIELPSGAKPIRLLAKTGAPVLAPSPVEARQAASPEPGSRSRITQALAALSNGTADDLPPLAGEGIHAEDLPARACVACQYPLPQDIDEREGVVVAVMGVNRVGKTHLLAAAATEAYKRRALAPIGCGQFVPDDATSARFMHEYQRPLFRRSSLLEATQLAADIRFRPLVFNVTLDGAAPFNLVMHDIAGEALADPRQRAQAATFLRAARAIIFVIDPRDIERVEERLPAWIVEDETQEIGFDQAALLSTCLGPGGIAEANGWLPVAVTVAKADLLREALDEPLAFLDSPDPASESPVELRDRIDATSRQVEELLERLGAHDLLAPARDYRRRCAEARRSTRDGRAVGTVTFHAVSALGSTPDPDGTMSERVRPINCVDPLAAVLAQIDL